ncbi:MAG: hypothetical protein ABF727_08900 [Gluconobacter oxydans]
MSDRYSLTKRQREVAEGFVSSGGQSVSFAQLERRFLRRVHANRFDEGLRQVEYEFECQQEDIAEVRSKTRDMEF